MSDHEEVVQRITQAISAAVPRVTGDELRTAVSAGHGGTATAGDGGSAAVGYGGSATAGYGGTIVIAWWDGTRRRLVIGYVGEDGVLPDTPYRVEGGRLVVAS